ncbi:PIG-L deacetylase family protein [[Eubacterium] cellulosolvens]
MITNKEVVVISPHLDDAALNCSDHILAWKRKGFHMKVVTIFSKTYSVSFETGCDLPAIIERRVSEDVEAMKILGVPWRHMDLDDARSRYGDGESIYIDDWDSPTLQQDPIYRELGQVIELFKTCRGLIVPLGVGKHIDHVLVRRAAEDMIELNKIYYYLDYPYALTGRSWTSRFATEIITAKKSIKWMSKEKRRLLKKYPSQIPKIFCRPLFSLTWISWALIRTYPEIILYPRKD